MAEQNHITEPTLQQKLNRELIVASVCILNDHFKLLVFALEEGDEITINSIASSIKNAELLTGVMLEVIDDI